MKNIFDVDGSIWIKKDNRGFIGRGRVELLQNIQIHGSISKAAKAMKMSYKAAWDSVDIMNKLSNKPLVTKITGGKGGGGTVITSHAKELIHAFEEVSSLYRNYFETLSDSFNEQIVDEEDDEPVFSRLQGVICDKRNVNENYEIAITLKSGQILTSIESMSWIFAALGFGYKYLNRPSNILSYLSQAVYPVYIIHMIFLYWASYIILPLNLTLELSLTLIILLTFIGCYVTYELIIKRIGFIRPLFGLKGKHK